MADFDVIVAGGGVAGASTAASLADQGYHVLLCEAGLPSGKRLAGELLHPPGVEQLDSLGLLEPMKRAGAVPVYGFAVFQSATDPGTILSYSEIQGGRPTGLALEHATLTRTLLSAVSERAGVTVWSNARVLDSAPSAQGTDVTIRRGEETQHVSAYWVVSAEGRRSQLREQAGISTDIQCTFRMLGWKLRGARLPYPGYGHLFIAGETPILAYQVSRDEVRVMVELGLKEGLSVPPALLASIPQPFREDLIAGMKTHPRTTARVVICRPQRVTGTSLAVVGDAGGCVHPLTASGMSFCIADGRRLAEAMGPRPDGEIDVSRGLFRYARSRLSPMTTRAALGPAMIEALCGRTPAMRLLRHGLFRYWNQSSRGRSVSMGLLSTREVRMGVMAREYAMVFANALAGIVDGPVPSHEVPAALGGLVHRTAGFARTALGIEHFVPEWLARGRHRQGLSNSAS